MAVNVCGLQAAESNRTILRYLQEANNCWGATPATGSPREMRLTSSSLTSSKKTVVSNEVRADRMISSVVATAYDSGGDIQMEFAAGNVDDFMAAFLLGGWSRPMTFDNFSGSAVTIFDNGGVTEFRITGSTYVDYFVPGRRLKSEGFIKPVNNDFWQIVSVSFAAGVTTVVTTGTTAITEVGTNLSKVFDANDVIILKSTAIRAGTLGAQAFDSNGTNAFASAIVAKQLQIGQRIHVLGLGYGVGTLTLTAQPLDGEIFTIADGASTLSTTKTVVFEFDNNSAFTRGRIPITIGATFGDTAANIQKAVMNLLASNKLNVSASVTAGVVTLRNLTQAQGGSITEGASNTVAVTFTGGSATKHGVFSIAALTDDVITVNEPVATDANAGPIAVTIKGSHLRNPGDYQDIKPQSFSIETGFTDVSQYFMQTGMRVGGFEIKIKSGALLQASISLKGKETATRNVTTLGAVPYTPLAATSTSVMNATTNVGSIYKNGVEMTAAIMELELKGSASLREQMAVGSKFSAGVAAGRFNLTGKFSSYFETLELYDDFLNHNTIGLAFSLTDNESNSYWFNIPALKITSDPISPGAIDTDIMENMDFTAIRDPQLRTMFILDRFSSVIPATS